MQVRTIDVIFFYESISIENSFIMDGHFHRHFFDGCGICTNGITESRSVSTLTAVHFRLQRHPS